MSKRYTTFNTVHPDSVGAPMKYVARKFQMVWAALAFLFVTQSSDAALMNLIKKGDLIQDTVSDRYWLDLSKTTNHSYDEMLFSFGCTPRCKSGPFAGYTWASTDDVFGLITHSGLGFSPFIPIYEQDSLNAPHVDVWRFIQLIGATYTYCGPTCWSPGMSTEIDEVPSSTFYAVGMSNELSLDPEKPEGSVVVPGLSWDTSCVTWAAVELDSCVVSTTFRDQSYSSVGMWLFVSEPPTIFLMSGLMGVILVSRASRTADRKLRRGPRALP